MSRLLAATAFLTFVILGLVATAHPATELPPRGVLPDGVAAERAKIIELENKWAAAIVSRDVAVIGDILADDFNGTSPTGDTFRKRSAIEDLKSGTYQVESMELGQITVTVYGNAALVLTCQVEKSEYGGADTSGHYHFTNTWLKRNGKWQVVASHGSEVKEPK